MYEKVTDENNKTHSPKIVVPVVGSSFALCHTMKIPMEMKSSTPPKATPAAAVKRTALTTVFCANLLHIFNTFVVTLGEPLSSLLTV